MNRTQILAVACSHPPHVSTQEDVEAYCARIFGAESAEWFARLASVYGNTGIETRHVCMPLEWYAEPHGWPERMELFERHALALMQRAAEQALARAGVAAADVDAVIAVSTTGFSTPSLDALLIERLRLPADVRRLPVFGLGCAGGVLGLARGDELARAEPGDVVLLVGVELCSLTFRAQELSKENVVASALFGDAASAVVLRAESATTANGTVPAVVASGEHTWPDSREVMGWRVENDGFGVVFSRHIPSLIRRDFQRVVDSFLERCGHRRSDLAGYLLHPGGAKVLDAYRQALDLDDQALEHSRAVLRDYGNLSSVSVVAVLERVLGDLPPGVHLMAALGPGFSAALLLLEVPTGASAP